MEETPNTLHTETVQSAEKPLQSDSFSQKVSIFKREATKSLNMKKIFKGVLCIFLWIGMAWSGLMVLCLFIREDPALFVMMALACGIGSIPLYNKFLRGVAVSKRCRRILKGASTHPMTQKIVHIVLLIVSWMLNLYGLLAACLLLAHVATGYGYLAHIYAVDSRSCHGALFILLKLSIFYYAYRRDKQGFTRSRSMQRLLQIDKVVSLFAAFLVSMLDMNTSVMYYFVGRLW
jgi:hypothetical protein